MNKVPKYNFIKDPTHAIYLESTFWPNVVTELSCITFWIAQALENRRD